MAYLKIAPGIGTLSDVGRNLSPDIHRPPEDMRAAVLARDDHTCRYCGFKAMKYQETNYVGGKTDTAAKQKPAQRVRAAATVDDYVTACTFCHQCFHLDRVDRMQSGAIVWLPEIGQAALNHMCRAIYVSRISQGPMADAARDALEALLARREEARNRLGADSAAVLATVLQDFLEIREYRGRLSKLRGFRILPLDRRIIREGDLEFNQFPQMLAYWRSKEGPFGPIPPRQWAKLFFNTQNAVQNAAPAESAAAADDA